MSSEPDSDTVEGSASLPMYYPQPAREDEDWRYDQETYEQLQAQAIAKLRAKGDFELAALVANAPFPGANRAEHSGGGRDEHEDEDHDDDDDDDSEDGSDGLRYRMRFGVLDASEEEEPKDTRPFDIGKLPPELYDNIMEYLESVTDVDILRSLCAVNKAFNARFTPYLYSHISLIHPTGGYKQKNALHTDLVSTLASRDNEHYKHVRSISLVDQLVNNAYSDIQPPVLSLVCGFLKKSHLKEICINIDGTTLEPNGVGDFKNSSAEDILLDHSEVEKIEWSLFVNRLEGRVQRDRWRHLTRVANTERPALKSLSIFNIYEFDSLHGLKALLKSATELRELGLGIIGWPQDSIYIDDTSSPNFEGDIDQQAYYDLLMNDDDQPPFPMDTSIEEVDGADAGYEMISLTHHIFFFIDTRCAIRESLTSLRLEKTRLDLHKDTPLLISKCLDIKALQKLVLLDCKGLPRLLDLLETSEMKSLKTIHLEYRKRYCEDVNRFLDRLPVPPTDLALMQSGGGIKLPGSKGSWPSYFAPHLRSLVLDARKEAPYEDWATQADFVEVFEPGCTGVSLDVENERLFLQNLFGMMTKLEELGLSIDLDELTAATPDSKFLRLPKNRPTERKKGKERSSEQGQSSSSSSSSSSFLSWLTGEKILPRLRTFQLRNSRKLGDIQAMKEIFGINYNPSQSSDFRLQADVEHLHSILPQVEKFILGVKRPNQHFHATPPVDVRARRFLNNYTEHDNDDDSQDEHDPMVQLLRVNDSVERKQTEMWHEMMYLMLYIVCQGKRNVDRRPLHKGIPVETVGRVLPHHHWNAWHGRRIRVGCTEVMEEQTLPKCWRDVGSSVYEAGWSR